MSETKLTKKAQVLAAVAAGAKIEVIFTPCGLPSGLLRLVRGCQEISAWQTALQAANRKLELPQSELSECPDPRSRFRNKAHQRAFREGWKWKGEGGKRNSPYDASSRSSAYFRKAWLAGYDARADHPVEVPHAPR